MNALDDMRRMYRDYATALEAELARLRKIETAARGLTVHYHVEETPLESTVTLRKHLWDALRTALNAHLASEEGECGFTKAYADALKALAEGSDHDHD